MEEFHIRNVMEEDFLKIAEIARECHPMVTERNSIYHIFTKFFRSSSLVMETKVNAKGNIIVGFLLGFISQENQQDAYIHLLCVAPEYRGNALAKALIMKFMDIMVEKGCHRVYLITKPRNKTAIEFYGKLGFKAQSIGKMIKLEGVDTVKDYNGRGEDMVVFCKTIR